MTTTHWIAARIGRHSLAERRLLCKGGIKMRLAGSLIVLAASWGMAGAQEPHASSNTPQLQTQPLVTLANTQPSDGAGYELGPGDEVDVAVVGRPELSGTHTIGPDGRITLPIAGSVVIGGSTRDRAAATITEVLSRLYVQPTVTVQVDKYGSNHIVLIGAVEHPGVLEFDGTPTLLEAITRGGLISGPDKKEHMPTRCIIYRDHDQIGEIRLKDVLRTGDIRLHRNDIVYVPGDEEEMISVLGEVKSPGPILLRDQSTLISLIADAGGITPQAGNPAIQIIHPASGVIQSVRFKDLLSLRGRDVTIRPGDIVYVPQSGIAHVGFFLQQIAPAAELGTVATLAGR